MFRIKALEPFQSSFSINGNMWAIKMAKGEVKEVPVPKALEFIQAGWASDDRLNVAPSQRIKTGERSTKPITISPINLKTKQKAKV